MLQKPTDKLHNLKGHAAVSGTSLFSVFKGHFTVFDLYDAIIGYCNLKNVAGQISDSFFSITHGLDVYVPVYTPNSIGNLVIKSIPDHDVFEPGFIDLGQRL